MVRLLQTRTLLGQLWRNVRTASGAAPPTGAPHPHPHRRRKTLGVFFRAWLQRPKILLAHPPPQQLRQHRSRPVRGNAGEPRVADPLHSPGTVVGEKKGGETLRTDGVHTPCSLMPGPAGTPRCSPRHALGWQAPCHQRGRGPYSGPPPKPGTHQAQAYPPSVTAKKARERCSRDCSGAWEPPTLTCLGFTRGWGQLTAPSPADSANNCPPSHSLPRPFRKVERPSSAILPPREEGGPGKCSPGSGLPPAPSGPERSKNL
ncbi:hypothetical protein GWK47_035917 [Chionoecetes opilio]|uniref:Uncharacterized protein n=1 Tax=Chionoecetes opilio TaxID=41210 RepID=A0A8J4YTQ7_CHIOP|nr:hypothetical protein GWK47_035917 [Chionoecetes opilio]